jgi:DNA-binding NarL/FixJ family response regulator
MTVVRVVIADDSHVFRYGLRLLLQAAEDVEVVGEAADTDEAVSVVLETRPDVVVMDLHMPRGGGIDATERLRAQTPRTAVLVLTMQEDGAWLRRALQAGARGYLLKDADPGSVVRAVRTVADGAAYFGAGAADHVLSSASDDAATYPFPALTGREREVLDRLARGLGNDAIAARLGISTKTVQNNVSALLLKLGVATRAQAVVVARDKGLGRSGPAARHDG